MAPMDARLLYKQYDSGITPDQIKQTLITTERYIRHILLWAKNKKNKLCIYLNSGLYWHNNTTKLSSRTMTPKDKLNRE